MTRDIEDAIRGRSGIRPYIEEVGSVNTVTEKDGRTVYDIFLGPEDVPALSRFNDGEFGGTIIVDDGMVVKATIRLGAIDVTRGETDTFLLAIRVEEVVKKADPPVELSVDIGDFDQGVPHLRYTSGIDDSMRRMEGEATEDEFGAFLVRVVEEYERHEDRLQAIADGDEVTL